MCLMASASFHDVQMSGGCSDRSTFGSVRRKIVMRVNIFVLGKLAGLQTKCELPNFSKELVLNLVVHHTGSLTVLSEFVETLQAVIADTEPSLFVLVCGVYFEPFRNTILSLDYFSFKFIFTA